MYILFDIGGTNTRIALSKDGIGFEEPLIYKTPKNFDEGINQLVAHGKTLLGDERATAVSGGIAGPLNSKHTKLVSGTNIPGWAQKPIHKELFKAFGTDVYLENDAVLVGLGETHYGGGKNNNIVVYITVSTGIGGARFVNGYVDENALGFEPGNQIIDVVNNLTLEQLAGGANLRKKYKMPVRKINDPQIWNEVTNYLAVGLNNITVLWSPDIIVLGGGLIQNNAIDLELLTKMVKEKVKIFPRIPKIVGCHLGSTGGLYGALVHAKQQLKLM